MCILFTEIYSYISLSVVCDLLSGVFDLFYLLYVGYFIFCIWFILFVLYDLFYLLFITYFICCISFICCILFVLYDWSHLFYIIDFIYFLYMLSRSYVPRLFRYIIIILLLHVLMLPCLLLCIRDGVHVSGVDWSRFHCYFYGVLLRVRDFHRSNGFLPFE